MSDDNPYVEHDHHDDKHDDDKHEHHHEHHHEHADQEVAGLLRTLIEVEVAQSELLAGVSQQLDTTNRILERISRHTCETLEEISQFNELNEQRPRCGSFHKCEHSPCCHGHDHGHDHDHAHCHEHDHEHGHRPCGCETGSKASPDRRDTSTSRANHAARRAVRPNPARAASNRTASTARRTRRWCGTRTTPQSCGPTRSGARRSPKGPFVGF